MARRRPAKRRKARAQRRPRSAPLCIQAGHAGRFGHGAASGVITPVAGRICGRVLGTLYDGVTDFVLVGAGGEDYIAERRYTSRG